jgi:hypothetical protein
MKASLQSLPINKSAYPSSTAKGGIFICGDGEFAIID